MSEQNEDLSINDIADHAEDQMKQQEQQEKNQNETEENDGGDEQSTVEGDPFENQQQDPYDISLDDIPEAVQSQWIEQMLFEEQVTDEREIAGGEIPIVLKISTGESDVEIFELVREYIEDVQDKTQDAYSDSEINTMVSIAHCALAVVEIKGEKPGGSSPMRRFKWFNKKPIPLINRILKEYQRFEYELSLVLDQEDGIKN